MVFHRLLIISIFISTPLLYNLGKGYRYLQYGGYIISPTVGVELISEIEIYIIIISSLAIASLLNIVIRFSEFWKCPELEEQEIASGAFKIKIKM